MSIPLKSLPKVSDRLIYIRRLLNLTQSEMAEMAGTTQQAIQQAEAGKARNPRYLAIVAQKIGIPHEWLALNIMPEKSAKQEGLADKGGDVLRSFYGMNKKDQDLILELMKTRHKKKR